MVDFSIELQKGHIYGLIGNNGAGKSTFFHILAGLIHPSDGNYSILGAATERDNRKQRRKVGFLFMESGLSESMTAMQNLIALQKLKGYKAPSEARNILSRVGLERIKVEHELISTYSTGQRQRVALAAALLGQPEILIWDEPLTGLDPEAMQMVNDILREECQSRQVTILLSSHNLPQLYQLATDYIFIHHGKLIEVIDHETLCQRRIYVVTLKVSPLELAKQVIQKAAPNQSIRTEEDQLILDDCTISSEKLYALLSKNGAAIQEISSSGSFLEDYFMTIIGERP